MSINELDSKVKELRELRRMQEELAAEAEALQDAIKAHMDAHGMDTLLGVDWRVTFKNVTTSRLDTAALRKAAPDLCERFTRTNIVRRFCVA